MIWKRRFTAIALVAVAVLAAYFLWFRDSSLVAVKNVSFAGSAGADTARIRTALAHAAAGMTTLHVQQDELDRAVSAFPVVKAVHAEPSFPNGLAIELTMQPPALVVVTGSKRTPAAADGTLLRGVRAQADLPVLRVDQGVSKGRLTGEQLEQAVVLGTAPAQLRRYIEGIEIVSHGVRVDLRGGPEVRFGDGSSAPAKWAAATKILTDSEARAAAYVDVSAPQRPAVGGIVQRPPASAAGAAPGSG